MQNGFHSFLRPYLRRHFQAIAVDRSTRPDLSVIAAEEHQSAPLIVYANHPSWWDPLIAHFMNRTLLAGRQFYAPIDAEALQQYRVFEKLGFFGVELDQRRGAAAFLTQSRAILASEYAALWITPEGRFADARDHQAELMPGLSHLCQRQSHGYVMAMAIEYVFWEERLPVCVIRFSEPQALGQHSDWRKPDWHDFLTRNLRTTQAELSEIAMDRDSSPLDNLLAGKQGAGILYDGFRRVRAKLSGREFRSQHGKQFGS